MRALWDVAKLPPAPSCLQPAAPYAYPCDSDPSTRRIKRIAAKCGRAFGRRDRVELERQFGRLVEAMRALPRSEIVYWRHIVMIDGRWQGATGQGAYWAVASEAANRAASLALEALDLADGDAP